MSRIADLPIYAQRTEKISSQLYNLWRRTKIHFTLPMRIGLPGYKDLTLILESDEWVCVDESLNEMPVMAWVAFEDQGRDALHTPVYCKINYYHYAASKIRESVLNQLEKTLDASLKNQAK